MSASAVELDWKSVNLSLINKKKKHKRNASFGFNSSEITLTKLKKNIREP